MGQVNPTTEPVQTVGGPLLSVVPPECFAEVVSHVRFAQELTSPITSASVWKSYPETRPYAEHLLSSHPAPEPSPCLSTPAVPAEMSSCAVNILLHSQDVWRPTLEFHQVPPSGIRMSINAGEGALNCITASFYSRILA